MKIKIKGGKVVKFSDSGDLSEQVKNLSALIRKIQRHATELQILASDALSVDPSLVSLNRALQHQVKTLQNTLSITEKQIRRNKEETKNA